ncbi:MAG: hypothetical protein ACOC9D_06360, partial [Thermodesulfobacteriota bacterium]
YTVTVEAEHSDYDVNGDTVSFDVTVEAQDVSLSSAGDKTAEPGETVTAEINSSNYNSSNLDFNLTSGPGSVDNNGNYEWDIPNSQELKTYTVTVEAEHSDYNVNGDTVSFDVTVDAENISLSAPGDRRPDSVHTKD